jgi:hypothetical protein
MVAARWGKIHASCHFQVIAMASGIAYREADQPADERKKERLIRHYVRRLGKLGLVVHSVRFESATHLPLLGRNPNPPRPPQGMNPIYGLRAH